MTTPEIWTVPDSQQLATEAAHFFLSLGQRAIAAQGHFRVALSGGSTPEALYRLLAHQSFRHQIEWSRLDFFFGDERCVPPDHGESNFRMANESLFGPLGIHSDHIHRIEGELDDPEHAAGRYEAVIRKHFDIPIPSVPRFDLILLGLGEDGHTASLFPGGRAVQERTRLVVPSTSPKGVRQRITCTTPLINGAETVVFLVTGAAKAAPVKGILEPRQEEPREFPGSLIHPTRGRLVWILDRAAASKLTMATEQLVSNEE